tara:strand:- start:284 stop:628 length:345 start_codon:yes stop_codon:yes gene_type:complete
MSTRAQIIFATRQEGQAFNKHPEVVNARFYKHHDGYPEGLGVDIAESILDSTKIKNWEIEHIDTIREDLEYIYYIWQKPECEAFISIFAGDYGNGEDFECIFVGNGQQLLNKYK